MRTATVPVSPSDGTTTRSDRCDAASTCASAPPTRTCGGPPAGTGRCTPSMDTGAPGTAQPGRRPEITCGTRPTLAVFVFELHVPIDIVAPALWRVTQSERDAKRRQFVGLPRMANELDAGLVRREATLLAVATDETGDDVFPVLP